MKVLFIEARKKPEEIEKIEIHGELPKNIHILYTNQYKNIAEQVKNQLSKKHNILGFEQLLGCSEIKLKAAPLLISSGEFHTLPLLNSEELFMYNPGKINKISRLASIVRQKEKAKISKFFASDKVAFLISLKPGQNNLKKAVNVKEKLKHKFREKTFFLLVSDMINPYELENFQFDIGVNFSCPGLGIEDKILNYKVLEYYVRK